MVSGGLDSENGHVDISSQILYVASVTRMVLLQGTEREIDAMEVVFAEAWSTAGVAESLQMPWFHSCRGLIHAVAFIRSFVRSFVRSLVRWFVHSFLGRWANFCGPAS